MELAGNIFEQIARFLMMLFGFMPMQPVSAIDPNCVEPVTGRDTIEMVLDDIQYVLPNDGEGFELTLVSYTPTNTTVYYNGGQNRVIGTSIVSRSCAESGDSWDMVFDQEWFDAIYLNYVVEATRRCQFESAVLIENEGTWIGSDQRYILRYLYRPSSPTTAYTASFIYPIERIEELDALLTDNLDGMTLCEAR